MPYDGRAWLARFWEKVPINAEGCWEWQGHRNAYGYGQITIDGARDGAHRVMVSRILGVQIPPGLHVCHTCDNPPCVRPSHLFVGTAKDNARDRQDKGRFTPPILNRDKHPRAKLTTAQCRALAARARPGRGGNTAALATEYRMNIRTINRLVKEFAE